MKRILFVCHGNILKSSETASKINGLTKLKGTYYTIFERALIYRICYTVATISLLIFFYQVGLHDVTDYYVLYNRLKVMTI